MTREMGGHQYKLKGVYIMSICTGKQEMSPPPLMVMATAEEGRMDIREIY